ncbi:MAG: DNA-methyltransferase [Promethearchaeota archaeon]
MVAKKRKNPYVPGIAAMNFRPDFDWTKSEANSLYTSTPIIADLPNDTIQYKDCIQGMKTLPESSIDLVVADPPFGIDFSSKENLYNRNNDFVPDGYEEVSIGDYSEFTSSWIREIPRIMKDTGSAYFFSGWNHLNKVLESIYKANLKILNHIIWKYQFGVFTKRKFVTSHYHVLFCVKHPKKYFFNKIEHYPEDVWLISRKYKPGQVKNSTKLPEEVVSKCINFSTKPGDVVFDPFMGNGTTAVCAKANYRHFIGYELNPNLKENIEINLKNTELGGKYVPYSQLKPTMEELAKKYPAVRKELRKKSEEN